MDAEVFTNEYLDRIRKEGDPKVDALVEHVLAAPVGGKESGRLDYNLMLDLADRIVATPSLRFVADSVLNQELKRVPAGLEEYFAPEVAPAWVDARKLELGARLWQQNMLAMLGVLYAYSLPACYLVAKGIPALFQTSKLRDPRYLSQRVYETGLMLDAVMGKDGISVVEDIAPGSGERTSYLWGNGYVTAKKVRFLHASMRYMLINRARLAADGAAGDASARDTGAGEAATITESLSRQASSWDTDALGAPVNQEDLAYTLLTFGYALPRGLERWGCPVSREERAGFLHLWRVVGHVMGIRDELMTDDWDEAEKLFDTIAARQANTSHDGVVLTESLLGFLAAYLPDHMSLSHRIAALMIIDQLGMEHAQMILRPELVRQSLRADRRAIYWVGRTGLRLYYGIRTHVLRRLPTVASLFGNLLENSAHQLIESWRDAYVRRPFYVPANSTTWQRQRDAGEAFVESLRAWRRKMFNTLGLAVGQLVIAGFSFAALLPAWLFGTQTSVRWTAIVCAVTALGAVATMKWRLPAVFAERPVAAD